MKASLVEMFGDAAVAIARSQPIQCDVGGESGVTWQDLVEAFDCRDVEAKCDPTSQVIILARCVR